METINLLQNNKLSFDAEKQNFALDVLKGLSTTPKFIPSLYFYDKIGSKLFQKITELPEYYLTRCEWEILNKYSEELANKIKEKYLANNQSLNVIELGVGDGHKSILLLDALIKAGIKTTFIPVDISAKAIDQLLENTGKHVPNLKTQAYIAEYLQALDSIIPKQEMKKKNTHENNKDLNLVLLLGSNIGNFDHRDAHFFWLSLWQALNKNDLLFSGFDLKKDISLLLDAYNDKKGITRDFNTNLLSRMNKELGGNFNKDNFFHYSHFNPDIGAMESYLISKKEQKVHIEFLQRDFSFYPFEPIHTEYSFKYSKKEVDKMAKNAGFKVIQHFQDSKKYFTDCLWQVDKQI